MKLLLIPNLKKTCARNLHNFFYSFWFFVHLIIFRKMRFPVRLIQNKYNFNFITSRKALFSTVSPVTFFQSQPNGISASTSAYTQQKPLQQLQSNPQSTPPNQNYSKLVIFHIVPRAKTLPSPSPFVIKLWTYLNMANIPYKITTKNAFGAKGKTPWITIDGENIYDSQIIIQHLGKKFDKNFGKVYSDEQLSISRATRILLEDHFFWGSIVLWRANEGYTETREKVFKIGDTLLINLYFKYIFIRRMKHQAWVQGMGRHSKEEIMDFMLSDLRAVSSILGNKKYILGDTPCEDDCGIFGILAEVMWGLPGSPYEKLIKDDLTNLKDYCERMKTTFWPNWDKELAR